MESFLTAIGVFCAALTFGAMAFFSFCVAPLVFIKLDADNASKLIRAIFPWYYLVVIAAGGLGALIFLTIAPRVAIGLAIAALGAFIARQGLMPRINGARDQANAGDEEAKARFDSLHRTSTRINAIGLIGALASVILIGLDH